jgi:DnaJ-like protein
VDPDLYRVLQVDPSAEPEVIDAAYKRLAHKYHPDHNRGDSQAADRMKLINEAFRVLSKPDQRAAYDLNHGFGLPELEVVPAEVVLSAVEPAAREISFSVRLQQTAGPSFDPAIHAIELVLAPPWHQAEVHWHWSASHLPAEVDFTLELADGLLKPGSTFSGDIELAVKPRQAT